MKDWNEACEILYADRSQNYS